MQKKILPKHPSNKTEPVKELKSNSTLYDTILIGDINMSNIQIKELNKNCGIKKYQDIQCRA